MKSRPKKPASSAARARQQAQDAGIRPSGQQQAGSGEGVESPGSDDSPEDPQK